MKIYLLGIKGTGMTGLAQILLEQWHTVTGSDTSNYFFTDTVLQELGISPLVFDPANVDTSVDMVITSAAYNETNNAEYAGWKQTNVRMISYPEGVALATKSTHLVSITGSHGKTTTTALIATLFLQDQEEKEAAGQNPLAFGALVGSGVPTFGGKNAYISPTAKKEKPLFFLESCEYKKHFLHYSPQDVLLTNIDFDHPDAFADETEYRKAYQEFINLMPAGGLLIISPEEDTLQKPAGVQTITYSMTFRSADYYGERVAGNPRAFQVWHQGNPLGTFTLNIPWQYNQENALATIAYAHQKGLSPETLQRGVQRFVGTKRRQERLGTIENITIYDDYAHHPTEIRKTIDGFRETFPSALLLVGFQAHTYSRTREFWDDFARCFAEADTVILHEIFGSARAETDNTVTGALLAEAIRETGKKTFFEPDFDAAARLVLSQARETPNRDIIFLCLGAGDGYQVGKKLLAMETKNSL